MNSMFVPGAWWPVSRQTIARSPRAADLRVGGAPVRNVGVVERRLEELVLEHEPLLAGQAGVDLLQRLLQAVLAAAQVGLAGVVRALGEPDLEVARAGGVHDVDALEVVVDRLAADRGVFVRERAELVVVVLEGVRVDRAERDAEVFGVAAQVGVVVDLVPRDVQRDARRERRHAVDLRGIRDLLERVARRAGRREDLEAGAGVAERPRGELDALALEGGQDLSGESVVTMRRFLWVVLGRGARSVERLGGGELVFEVEDLGERGGRLVGAAVEADEEAAHLGLPAGGDGGCREVRLRGGVVIGLVVADEPAALAEEERVVAAAGGGDLGAASRATPGCGARCTRRAAPASTRSWKQTRVVRCRRSSSSGLLGIRG